MCTLLHTHISRLSEPIESEELYIGVCDDLPAAGLNVIGFHKDVGLTTYAGTLRVHEGETWSKNGKVRADMSISWIRKCPDSQLVANVVPRNTESHHILAEELHFMP